MKSIVDNQKDLCPEVILSCLQCLEASTITDELATDLTKLNKYFEICADLFYSQLSKDFNKFEDPIRSKVSVNN